MVKKDIVLFTGPSASGKTTGAKLFMNLLQENKLLYETEVISTGKIITDLVKDDDQKGGLHHFHSWCMGSYQGHTHNANNRLLPFTTFDDFLNDQAYKKFFANLIALPQNNKVHIADWTAGVNINTKEPFSKVDRSYKKMLNKLKSGQWSNGWTDKIFAVIHPVAEYSLRKELNSLRQKTMDYSSWQLDQVGFNYYGKDDFTSIVPYFRSKGVEKIFDIQNNGTEKYFNRLEKVFHENFLSELTFK